MPPVIQIDHVDFSYGRQAVLRDIDLTVAAGTTLGLIGPNGGGKTTLIRLLLGVLRPTRGVIRVAGLTPRQAVGPGDCIGYLPQNPQAPSTLPPRIRALRRPGLS